MKTKIIRIFSLFLLLLSGFSTGLFAQEYAVTNVHIISMESDQILSDHFIHVKSGKILGVFPIAKGISLEEDLKVIDGNGAYVIPGLAEMHSHIPITETDDFSYVQDVMWLYLANGILNVRGMIGHPSHLALKKKIESGEIKGQEFLWLALP